MLIPIILFAIGLFALIKGGDWFVDGATGIAQRFHIPEILIGATVVSIGTTLPEVMVSSMSSAQGSGSMAYGNAIGSIICNTALIAALTIAIRPAKADKKALRVPVLVFFIAAAFYAFVSYFFGEFSRWVGIVLLVGFVIYMTILVIQAFKERSPKEEINKELVLDVLDDEVTEDKQSSPGDFIGLLLVGVTLIAAQVIFLFNGNSIGVIAEGASFGDIMMAYLIVGILGAILLLMGIIKAISRGSFKILNSNVIFIVIGAIVIAIGASLLIDNGTIIAKSLGVPETVIGLTFVALGTSLPELVTAVTALVKGHSALSLGNIIGANIFNLVLVSGMAITISPFAVPAEKTISGMNASLIIDLPLVFAVMGILTIPTLFKGKLSRWQGIVLLALYAGFCVFQFI